MGFFRIAKTFEVEYGHRLSKHPEKCRFPHGHSLRIEIVARGTQLDDNDMVCDFKAIKILVIDLIERLDHAMALSSTDPQLASLQEIGERVLLFENQDPTTEVLARWLYQQIAARIEPGTAVTSKSGKQYQGPQGLELERVRIWETTSSWAEYVGI